VITALSLFLSILRGRMNKVAMEFFLKFILCDKIYSYDEESSSGMLVAAKGCDI
jgi:hypothetical protein